MADEAQHWRERLLESLYDFSNELMELALAEEPIPEALIHKVLRAGDGPLQIQPVLCGSALHGMGVQPVLDAVAAYLPSPLDMPPVEGYDVKTKGKTRARDVEGETRRRSSASPIRPSRFAGWCSRCCRPRRRPGLGADLFRQARSRTRRVLNPGKDKKENVAQLWHIHASKKEEQVDEARAGDIVGVIGLRESITGDTLCDTREPILLESIEFPETVISMAIEPESTDDRKKLGETLDMLRKQDPTFRAVGKRGDRPDADQRHGRAAPGSDQAPAAARFQSAT